MEKISRFLYYWFPPVIWMVTIFFFSSRLSTEVTGEFVVDFIFFKSLHLIEYAILYFFLFRAFFSINNQQLSINYKFFLPLILSLIYAVSDEIHQTFVPTREGKIRDVLIGSSGILVMYIYIKTNLRKIKKFFYIK